VPGRCRPVLGGRGGRASGAQRPPGGRRRRGAPPPPPPAGTDGGRAPCGLCVCRLVRIAIARGRTRAVPPRQLFQPALVEGARAPCGPCVCRRLRIAIARGRAHDGLPSRPPTALPRRRWWRERALCAAHVCAAAGASRSRRDGHALCRPRDATALHGQRWRRARAPCGPRVCRRLRIAIAAGRARAVPPARRDRPPRPALAEGARAVRPVRVLPAAHRNRGGTITRCAARATRPPCPTGAVCGRSPCDPCVCRRRHRPRSPPGHP
jgi:hypothetical protein